MIDRLSGDLTPVERGTVARRLVLGLCAGILVSVLAMWMGLGLRHDLAAAMSTSNYWMKFFYTLIAALVAFWLVERIGRPGADAKRPALFELLPLGAILLLASATLMRAAPG